MISPPSALLRCVRHPAALALLGAAVVIGSAAGHDHSAAAPAGNAQHVAADGDQGFLAENEAAMTKMMADMDVKPTGNVDRDFVAMMIPHHQGAIDMAKAVLRHGKDETVRRLAQEIIVTQQDEIAAMRLAVGAAPGAPAR